MVLMVSTLYSMPICHVIGTRSHGCPILKTAIIKIIPDDL